MTLKDITMANEALRNGFGESPSDAISVTTSSSPISSFKLTPEKDQVSEKNKDVSSQKKLSNKESSEEKHSSNKNESQAKHKSAERAHLNMFKETKKNNTNAKIIENLNDSISISVGSSSGVPSKKNNHLESSVYTEKYNSDISSISSATNIAQKINFLKDIQDKYIKENGLDKILNKSHPDGSNQDSHSKKKPHKTSDKAPEVRTLSSSVSEKSSASAKSSTKGSESESSKSESSKSESSESETSNTEGSSETQQDSPSSISTVSSTTISFSGLIEDGVNNNVTSSFSSSLTNFLKDLANQKGGSGTVQKKQLPKHTLKQTAGAAIKKTGGAKKKPVKPTKPVKKNNTNHGYLSNTILSESESISYLEKE